MLLFGVNFSCYYLLLMRQVRNVFKDEELRLYFCIVAGSILLITLNLRGFYGTVEETVRHAAFQVSSIITTTGYATADFDLWPSFSKAILLGLMVVGACAGSTGGGLKCGRVLLLMKSLRRNIGRVLNPQKVQVVRNNNQAVDEKILDNTNAYLAAYVIIVLFSFIAISIDGFSTTTNFSAVLSCFNNIGPGLEAVGPTCNFSGTSFRLCAVDLIHLLLSLGRVTTSAVCSCPEVTLFLYICILFKSCIIKENSRGIRWKPETVTDISCLRKFTSCAILGKSEYRSREECRKR